MQDGIHPDYHPVIFRDVSTGDEIMSRSTMTSSDTREVDGVTYQVVNMDITSFTHPFYTGKQKLLDAEGRIDRFRRKYGDRAAAAAPAAAEAPASLPEPPAEEAADA